MASKTKLLQEFLQEKIDFHTEKKRVLTNKPIYAICIDYLIDDEHEALEFHLYISMSSNKKRWQEEGSDTKMYMVDVNDENLALVKAFQVELGFVELFDEEAETPKPFSKTLLSTLEQLDYSNLNLQEDCAFQVKRSDYY